MATYDTSDRYGLRALSPGSQPGSGIDDAFVALRDDVSALLAPIAFGARGSRPVSTAISPGIAGRRYMSNGDLGIDLDTGTSWVTDKPGFFTALPTASGITPGQIDEGMEILFQTAAMATALVPPYHLRYNASLSGTSKWDVISALPLSAETSAGVSTASNPAFVDLAGGPTITVPETGVYDVELGALMANDTAGGSAGMVAKLGAATATSATGLFVGSSATPTASTYARFPQRVLAAGDIVKAQYSRAGSIGMANFQNRVLHVTPRRVG